MDKVQRFNDSQHDTWEFLCRLLLCLDANVEHVLSPMPGVPHLALCAEVEMWHDFYPSPFAAEYLEFARRDSKVRSFVTHEGNCSAGHYVAFVRPRGSTEFRPVDTLGGTPKPRGRVVLSVRDQ
jgi:hypothetical protein